MPAENITAVELNPQDRDLMGRTVEGLVGLPDGVITRQSADVVSNRSMTACEAEFLRQINLRLAGSIDSRIYTDSIRNGVVRTIVENRQPPTDEPRITTPQWALEIALKRQLKDLRRLRRSGVDLRGSWQRLREPSVGSEPVTVTEVPVDFAALGVAIAVSWKP